MENPYKAAYKREKLARQAAEKLLDEKTREVYSNMDVIKFQYNELKARNREQNLLSAVTSYTQDELNFKEFLSRFVKLLGALGVADYVEVFLEEQDNDGFIRSDTIWYRAKPDVKIKNHKSKLKKQKLEDCWDLDSLREAVYLMVSDSSIYQKTREHLESEDIKVIVLLPIKRNGELIAVIEAAINKVDSFSASLFEKCKVALIQFELAMERRLAQQQTAEKYTELQSANREIEETHSKLIKQEKLASIGLLAAGIAHEINNPIGFTLSNFETLEDYLEDIIKLKELIEKVLDNDANDFISLKQIITEFYKESDLEFVFSDIEGLLADCKKGMYRVTDIVSSLKKFARMDNSEEEIVDIHSCIEECLKIVHNEIKYHCKLQKEFFPETIHVLANENQLAQVFLNLIVDRKSVV